MVAFSEIPILMRHITTLGELSADKHDESTRAFFMTTSSHPAVNFDAVKKDYIASITCSQMPKSVDAIFEVNGKVVFVEFKNGYIDEKTTYELKKKIYDSTLMFCDIFSETIRGLRECAEYILVYNLEKNKNNPSCHSDEEESSKVISSSSEIDKIAKTVSGYANTEQISFGLHMFQGYIFKRVHTYTEREFERYLEKNV